MDRLKEGKRKKTSVRLSLAALLLGAAVLAGGAALPVFAAPAFSGLTEKASLEDRADLLSDEEKQELLERAGELSQKTDFELRLLTVDDAGGDTTREIAEAYFESMTSDSKENATGLSYVIDMDNREIYVATYGQAQYYMTDDRVDDLLDDAYEYVSDEDYSGTFGSMLDSTEEFFDDGIRNGTRIYNEDTGTYTVYRKPREITTGKVILAAIFGAVSFLIVWGSVSVSYRMAIKSDDGFNAAENVRLQLTGNSDRLISHFVRTRRIPRDSGSGGSSGGGISTTHTTSGGFSAGGGGRKF